uniref:Uncharacterized protein n=1 Tax=Tanacetum cinerariifolium TaxID=118510 RepID=A0A6L2MZU1_TANCI|nr:hypothetical protein [Tanacetum cinerariifolium]
MERIDKELYGDFNVCLTYAEQDDGDEEDADMTYVAQVQVEQTQEQTTSIQEESGPEMASVHGQYVSTKIEVASMLDINVQQDVPRTSQLLTILVFVIPEHTIFNPSEIVTTAPEITITSLLSSLFPNLHQSIPIPTRINTEATTSTPFVLESKTLNAIHLRLSDLEKEVKKLKNIHHSLEFLSKIKFEFLNAAKSTLEQVWMMFFISPKHKALYHALMESILEDEDARDEDVADKLKKRKPDDDDKDEGPSARSD